MADAARMATAQSAARRMSIRVLMAAPLWSGPRQTQRLVHPAPDPPVRSGAPPTHHMAKPRATPHRGRQEARPRRHVRRRASASSSPGIAAYVFQILGVPRAAEGRVHRAERPLGHRVRARARVLPAARAGGGPRDRPPARPERRRRPGRPAGRARRARCLCAALIVLVLLAEGVIARRRHRRPRRLDVPRQVGAAARA